MTGLTVIVPSRGRPEAAHELVKAFDETCSNHDTQLVFAIDERDQAGIYDYPYGNRATTLWFESTTMVEALNLCASAIINQDPAIGGTLPVPRAFGFMGDDHRPRTVGWDRRYLAALEDLGTGMVYGNDLLQSGRLPTQIAMTTDIVRACGWMSPPDLVHLAVDNWWLELGQRAGCITYLPDVVIEHVHPVAGKAEWDEGHKRVNAPEMYSRDLATFARLRAMELPRAVAAVKALR